MNPLDRFTLDGRRALITGSTKGIGLAIAEAYAGAGASSIFLNSEAEDEASEIALSAVRAAGGTTEAALFRQDLSQPAAGAILSQKVLETTGGYGVDILVLNAAVQIEKPWNEITSSDFQFQVGVNLQSTLELLQGLVPAMEARGFGRVILISSLQAEKPSRNMMIYAATKAAMNNLAKNLSRIVAPSGVTVNTISPGIFNTFRNADVMANAEKVESTKKWVPLHRVGQPVDCAGVALLLASEAGAYITGANYAIDGGAGA